MSRITSSIVVALFVAAPLGWITVAHVRAQTSASKAPTAAPKTGNTMSMAGAQGDAMTDAQKIANAMSAGPAAVTKNAAIMDWPAEMGKGQPRQLRAGTNGWVCYPRTPNPTAATGEDPMCLDKGWQAWADAFMSKTPVKPGMSGIAYMLKGDRGASNIDPWATAPSPTNQWVVASAHVMVLFPDLKALDAYPTDPKQGGPWVMWKGTPYAHLMVPMSAATMTMK